MKELSVEEKAKRYDEAIKVANKYKDTHIMFPQIKDEIFPELCESEDERIKILIGEALCDSKLSSEEVQDVLAWLEKQGEQKPAWSEEDEKLFNSALWHIKNSCGNGGKNYGEFEVYHWFRNLKNRMLPEPEWNEETKAIIYSIIADIKYAERMHPDVAQSLYDEEINFLKSLRPQNRWKPSDEQMDALQYVYRNLNPLLSDKLGWNSLKTLEMMYQDLKKLKG